MNTCGYSSLTPALRWPGRRRHSLMVSVSVGVLAFSCALGSWGRGMAVAQTTSPGTAPAGALRWRPYFDAGRWAERDGTLHSTSPEENSARLADLPNVADVLMEARVRVSGTGYRNFGFVLRAHEGLSCQVVRYHHSPGLVEMLGYDKGRVTRFGGEGPRIELRRGEWFRFKAAAVGATILGKLWAEGEKEPDWQLRRKAIDSAPGACGILEQDGTEVTFADIRIDTGAGLEALRTTLAREEQERQRRVIEKLTLQVEPTPLLHRVAEGPARQVAVRTLVDGKPEPVGGKLTLTFEGNSRTLAIEPGDFADGAYPLLVDEPAQSARLELSFEASAGKRLNAACEVAPVRKWKLYMTPHTHFDIGYTDPQPVVLERLSRDMDTVIEYLRETADWPEESRFRWTVEVSGLMKNYIARHEKAEIDRFVEAVKSGRIEVCGFYLNMPTEVVGHEELIRCLYYAQELRRTYGLQVDTAMIHDVPGYTWALPGLLLEAGLPRISLCANTIRGKFTWDRPGSVTRPFYWEGPDGRRVFVWYTHNYGDAHYFRSPGRHEKEILATLRANEAVGYPFDAIQLGTASDNQPPELNTCRNVRAWNEKYVWPRLTVATNREFLEAAERDFGARCKVYRGDIPSWWAEGPASSASENATVRLAHDRLSAAEAMWAMAHLADPKVAYPREDINAAYDQMLHFDEHTWGARAAASHPKDENTLGQWAWKARYAHETRRRTDALHAEGLRQLSDCIRSSEKHAVAVWNLLAWPRTEPVTVSLRGTALSGVPGIDVVDLRSGKHLPAHVDRDNEAVVFLAPEVPAMGYAVFALRAVDTLASSLSAPNTIENEYYRIIARPEAGGLVSIYDKKLGRELLDQKAEYLGNQPIYERSLDGRDAITRKRPSRFKRDVPTEGRSLSCEQNQVFSQMVLETRLPSLPLIRQTIRLYEGFPAIDIRNTVTKEEIFEPEGVYFAFPFDAESPDFRLQIADAVMRPGREQLPYSCQEYYSIGHWAGIGAPGCEILFVPVEAPLLTLSGLNAYQWADQIDFNNGHVFSWVMNNYWYTNFRPGQSGTMDFRYRISSRAKSSEAAAITQWAWQAFQPLLACPLKPATAGETASPASFLRLEGDPVVVSGVKLAETEDSLVVRLLELNGRPARCTLWLSLPDGQRIRRARRADCLERPVESLAAEHDAVAVTILPSRVTTLLIEIDRGPS